jgi:hypothetical protein
VGDAKPAKVSDRATEWQRLQVVDELAGPRAFRWQIDDRANALIRAC